MAKISIILLLNLVCSQVFSQAPDSLKMEWGKMNSSKAARYEQYNEAKFGMFIHWGAYSELAGTWKGEQISKLGEWIMYHAQISRSDYREVCSKFNPTGFDAETWVKLAKEAGMKYIVAMTKHHDGFSMYHSEVSDFNIYDYSAFKRDPIEELYNACKKYNIRLGLYYSHSIDWMDGGDAGYAQKKRAVPSHSDHYGTNLWDPSSINYDDYLGNKAKPQMREILKKFPDLIEVWYDFARFMNKEQSFEFYKLAYEIQPKALINSRVGNDFGDFLVAGDNQIPKTISPDIKAWETPGTLNNTWGYKSYDNDWKSFDEMLYWIVEIASKGGNYLLNVGPDGKGIIPVESVRILKEIGKWMKVNGEAIYGTRRWSTLKEGPTLLEMKSTTDREEKGFNLKFTSQDFWFTQKGKTIFVISLIKPIENKTIVKSLFDFQQQIKNIQLLGFEKELKWVLEKNQIVIQLPKIKNDSFEHGFVLKVEMK